MSIPASDSAALNALLSVVGLLRFLFVQLPEMTLPAEMWSEGRGETATFIKRTKEAWIIRCAANPAPLEVSKLQWMSIKSPMENRQTSPVKTHKASAGQIDCHWIHADNYHTSRPWCRVQWTISFAANDTVDNAEELALWLMMQSAACIGVH